MLSNFRGPLLPKLEKLGDPLPRLDSIVDWQAFRPLRKVIRLNLSVRWYAP